MGLIGMVLMVVAVSAGGFTRLDGFFTAASSVLLKVQGARTAQCDSFGVCGVSGDPVVWARGLDRGCRYVECWYHSGVFLYLLLCMEDCAYWAGPRDVQAYCAEQVL